MDEMDSPILKTDTITRKNTLINDDLPDFIYDTTMDPKTRARLIEKEMNEQAKILEDLKQLGATQTTLETEAKKLHELEQVVFTEFRQDMLKKFKKRSVNATSFKDKLMNVYKPTHTRSRSTGTNQKVLSSFCDLFFLNHFH